MNKKLIVLNGPPRCGKDTLAKHLTHGTDFVHVKFAHKLKVMTHRLYGIPNPEDIYQFEDCKDEPNPAFYELKPRQAYIEVSERYIKPVHGMSFFGDRLLETIKESPSKTFVASDGGLIEELIPIVEGLGKANVLVVKIYRPEHDFTGDSRGYYPEDVLDDLRVETEVLYNSQGLISFLELGEEIVDLWLTFDEQMEWA